MARKIYRGYARDGNGTILSSATVYVYLTGTSTAASVYTASSGGTAVNSVTTDSTGLYSFYTDYSDYTAGTLFRLTISKTGYDNVTYDEVDCLPPTFSTDGTCADNSDSEFMSEKAVKTYVDTTAALYLPLAGGTLSGSLVLSGGQIAFPATANPSTNANTLDDYEEGTWTPVIKFGGNAVGQTYNAITNGQYVKIGRFVFVTFNIVFTEMGSSTGDATITGLPFAVSQYSSISTAYVLGVTYSGYISGYARQGEAAIQLIQNPEAGNAAALTHANFTDASQIIASLFYITAA